MMRLIFNSIAPIHTPANSFWGMGVSQGHSDAIRRLEGVENAIQYTIPSKKIVAKCGKEFDYVPKGTEKHERLCYVALKPGADAEKIAALKALYGNILADEEVATWLSDTMLLEVDTMTEDQVKEHIENVKNIVNEYYDLVAN